MHQGVFLWWPGSKGCGVLKAEIFRKTWVAFCQSMVITHRLCRIFSHSEESKICLHVGSDFFFFSCWVEFSAGVQFHWLLPLNQSERSSWHQCKVTVNLSTEGVTVGSWKNPLRVVPHGGFTLQTLNTEIMNSWFVKNLISVRKLLEGSEFYTVTSIITHLCSPYSP